MADEKQLQEYSELVSDEYKYGFRTETTSFFETEKGLSEEIIRQISAIKNEPEWMLDIRLKAYEQFLRLENPKWGPDLNFINFDDYKYYIKPTERQSRSWDDVPDEIKETFDKLGIPKAEQEFLAGVSTQFESEVVYSSNLKELEEQGVIFLDTDSAVQEYPELVKKYFTKCVPYTDNKYAALNTAVWSGGTFIYVPKGVKLEKPLQSYFRINSERMGQFERTLIIVDEDADVHYVEGCTAPIYTEDSLHAAVVEIFIHDNGHCRYTTIQNWASNILNLVTKRAMVDRGGHMEWIDGNLGSGINMKYPACILRGEEAKGTTISIAFASSNQNQDSGAKMIHLAPRTSSTIISKSMSRGGGAVNYRGLVHIGEKAEYAKTRIECDTIILDGESKSDTIPINVVRNSTATVEHEATVSKISDEQMFYLMSRGLTEEEAMEMLVMGFIEPFARELPLEYAVELNQLLKLNMEGSIG